MRFKLSLGLLVILAEASATFAGLVCIMNSCGVEREAAGSALPPAQLTGLPLPSQVAKSGQYIDEQRTLIGADFTDISGGQDDHVEASGDTAVFKPAWNEGGTHSILDAARAGYDFRSMVDYNGPADVCFGWVTAPAQDKLWVGLANWELDRWDWFQPEDEVLSLSDFLPYTAIDKGLFIAIVILGTDQTELGWVRIGHQLWKIDVVDTDGEVGEYTSLCLDSLDIPHIAYYDFTNTALKYAYLNGAVWHTETVDSGLVGLYASLELDSADLPHIAYWDNGNTKVKYARYDGSTWNIETPALADVCGQGCSLELDSADLPHIVYFDGLTGNIDHARFDGSLWQTEPVAPGSVVNCRISFLIDTSDQPHLAFPAGSDEVYAYKNGGAWQFENISTGLSHHSSGEYSFAIDSSGRIHIALYDIINYVPYYALRDTGIWTEELLPAPQYSGSNASLAVNSADEPVICSYGAGLEVWTKTGGSWREVELDMGWAGQYTSLKLDSHGYPCISYRHSGNAELRFARYLP